MPKEEAEVRANTSAYHILHGFLNPGFAIKSIQYRLLDATALLVVGTLPGWYMLKIAGEIKQASHAARCQRRLDRCRCLQEGVLYATLLEYLALVHMVIALLQLLAYYLHMPSEALVWRGLRGVFYASYLLSSFFLLMLLALNGLWLLLASLLQPVKAAPYAVAMTGVICCGVRYAARLAYIRTRVLHDLHGRLASRSQPLLPSPCLLSLLPLTLDPSAPPHP